jgi:glycosyltransferase involved in cell wall biosynthesis
MKILFVIKALDDIQGGAERVLVNVSSGLQDRGHDVSVLSFDQPGGTSFYPLNEEIARIPLGIGHVKCKTSILEVIRRIQVVRKTVIKIKPDVVVAFMHSAFIPTSIALIGSGVPVIASEHIVPDYYASRKLEYRLLLLSRFFVNKFTVLSSSILNSYDKVLHPKMVVIANPVSPAHAQADAVAKDQPRKIILNVGRLTAQKDQLTLIRAFAQLADIFPDWDLRIIGNGELRDKLDKEIIALGLKTRVKLPGITSNIEREYQQSQIFALSSVYESFGLATAEAMGYGLPTIGFVSCPGTNELIRHNQNGLLVDGDDRVQALAEGLKTLMSDATLRKNLGKNGINDVAKFHLDGILDEWEALIRASI